MRKSVVLMTIAIVVVGMMMAFRIFVTEDPYEGDQSVGKALMEMEQETDKRVENLLKEIESGRLPQSDCKVQIKDAAKSILDNLEQLEDDKGNYLNVAYNCNIIRKLAGRVGSKKDYEEAELELRRDNLSLFSDKVFNFALDFSANRQEEADYIELSKWAKDIEANLDQEIERYTKRVYAWYTEK